MSKKQVEQTGACLVCGARFVCGADSGLAICWCMEKATGMFEPESGARCYCPECLDKRLSKPSFLAA